MPTFVPQTEKDIKKTVEQIPSMLRDYTTEEEIVKECEKEVEIGELETEDKEKAMKNENLEKGWNIFSKRAKLWERKAKPQENRQTRDTDQYFEFAEIRRKHSFKFGRPVEYRLPDQDPLFENVFVKSPNTY